MITYLKKIIRPKYFIARLLFRIAKILNFLIFQITKISINHISIDERVHLLDKSIYKFNLKNVYKILNKDVLAEDISFSQHNVIVKEIYGDTEDVVEGNISNELLQKLLKLTKETGGISPLQAYEEEKDMNSLPDKKDNSNLLISEVSLERIERESKNMIVHPLRLNGSDLIIKELHLELRKIYSSHIKSPFIFVNTRLWTSKPSGETFGANTLHLDGFEPGHLKMMVYLTPFDNEHGYFKFENKIVNNKPAGFSLMFKNSDVIHSGVPGTKQDRIALEVTIMRALVNGDQISTCCYWGRHLKNPMVGYLKVN